MGAQAAHDERAADGGNVQSRTVSSKGQLTISAEARRKLSIAEGDHLLEVVVGGFLIYVPEQVYLTRLLDAFQESLQRADLTAEALLNDMEAHKEETFQELYPNLAGE
ncbi:MAG: AbrB/MazE/SpoVT family DNA-binding domain-containing protein [Chloroflexi bacterium]|nr:AbrB/MazE/SpoVT family DNA-binding domain-containing protein [Chloroflexota bacterium]